LARYLAIRKIDHDVLDNPALVGESSGEPKRRAIGRNKFFLNDDLKRLRADPGNECADRVAARHHIRSTRRIRVAILDPHSIV